MKVGPLDIQLPSLSELESAAEHLASAVRDAPATVVDGFERVAHRVATDGVKLIYDAQDPKYDGDLLGANGPVPPSTPLDEISAVLPAGGVRQPGTIIEVNGVGCDLARQKTDLAAVADATGCKVIGLHNATGGLPLDAAQELGDEVHLGPDASSSALARVIERELAAGDPVHIVAHSQGAAVTARALFSVQADLEESLGSKPAAEAALGKVTVETYGGAAWSYPDGPQYTHYVNLADPVPQTFGMGLAEDLGLANAGRGAKIVTFSEPHAFHSLQTYLTRRLPDPA